MGKEPQSRWPRRSRNDQGKGEHWEQEEEDDDDGEEGRNIICYDDDMGPSATRKVE